MTGQVLLMTRIKQWGKRPSNAYTRYTMNGANVGAIHESPGERLFNNSYFPVNLSSTINMLFARVWRAFSPFWERCRRQRGYEIMPDIIRWKETKILCLARCLFRTFSAQILLSAARCCAGLSLSAHPFASESPTMHLPHTQARW